MSEFLSENFPFLYIKFSIYLNKRILVMNIHGSDGLALCIYQRQRPHQVAQMYKFEQKYK